uniref:Gamma-secretase subunit Aph-1 n=1 Tax=Romanomermis culicivorax TaxID=13658 RepID=A0A915JN23_ROMCU
MGALECAGCAMIAFGAPFSLFVFFIACDPLRVIICVAGAFFWLLSLLVSSLLWFAMVPLRQSLIFGLLESVFFQEIFRYLYYSLLKKAELGLDKLSAKGMHIEGVHSLKNAKHTTALVVGLGFGVISGAFSLINVLADGSGPGTLGLPTALGLSQHYATYTFFVTSSLLGAAIILLHIAWNVLFWHGLDQKNYYMAGAVVVDHFAVSLVTLCNSYGAYGYTISIVGINLLVIVIWTYKVAGGSLSNFKNALVSCLICRCPPPVDPDEQNG